MTSSKAAGSQQMVDTGTIAAILHKMDRIEEGQGETIKRLDALHSAIYEPDDGLFARIKAGSAAAERRAIELDQKYAALDARFAQAEKSAIADDTKLKKLDDSSVKVEDLVKWKKAVNGALRWLVIAILTGSGGILAKLLFDWFQGHVRVV